MKKISFMTAILLMAAILGTSAQPNQQKREQLKVHKIAFITERLQLTPDEAQKFWPLYNEFEAKQEDARNSIAERFQGPPPHIEALSDEELDDMILERLAKEEMLVDLKMEYYGKFKEILPVRKVFLLYQAEMDFRKELLERFQHKHRGGK